MALVGGGGQAELALVHERIAMPVPEGMSWAEAGGFPEVFITAHDALFTQAGLAMGEKVLVHGAAGGVGTAAVQMAASTGARVTATVRDRDRHQEVAALGADRVLSPEELDDLADERFDVILELVGAPNFPRNYELLATGGRISVIGTGAGTRTELDLRILMSRRAKLFGSTLRARPLEQKADAALRVETHVLPAVAAGRIRVPITATYPLDAADQAYDRFKAGHKFGKIVLLNDA
jgi:NADPH:quinone reductase